MQYDLSANDRFFLNQLIPKWETGKPFDLYGDMKYIFHREKGINYNPAQFEYTLKTISAFLSDHGFAKENPAKQYTFNLLPKGNSLMVKGTIELFELYQGQDRVTGNAIVTPARDTNTASTRPDVYDVPFEKRLSSSLAFLRFRSFIILLTLLAFIGVLIWSYMNAH